MTGIILAFGLDEREVEHLSAICEKTELELQCVRSEEYGNMLGALIGLFPKQPDGNHPMLPGKMLVFAFVPDPMLNYVLAEIRAAAIAPGSYKAILTQNNVLWTVPELFEELRREREELNDHP